MHTPPMVLSAAHGQRNVLTKDYILKKMLGKGQFSRVYLAEHRLTGTPVAIKVINRLLSSVDELNLEIRAMKLVRGHPHTVTLYEVFEYNGHVYMVMDYCPGASLDDYLTENGKIQERQARTWMMQLLSALKHCHQNRVVHHDIKPANIYLDENQNLKLGDFGLSSVTINAYTCEVNSSAGTPVYAAPEVYKSDSYYGPSAAMWALGTVLHVMLAHKLPFSVQTYPSPEVVQYKPPAGVSRPVKDLLKTLFALDPKKRPTEDEVLKHPWFQLTIVTQDGFSSSDGDSSSTASACDCLNCRNAGFSFSDIDACKQRARARMSELGFDKDEVLTASRSTAVYEPNAATFALLLNNEFKAANQETESVAS